MGRDRRDGDALLIEAIFQSTRPVWGATCETAGMLSLLGISIHAPRVGRDRGGRDDEPVQHISIHAPRVGRDGEAQKSVAHIGTFQSTRPVWGATETEGGAAESAEISIHAPRVGRDTRRPARTAT